MGRRLGCVSETMAVIVRSHSNRIILDLDDSTPIFKRNFPSVEQVVFLRWDCRHRHQRTYDIVLQHILFSHQLFSALMMHRI